MAWGVGARDGGPVVVNKKRLPGFGVDDGQVLVVKKLIKEMKNSMLRDVVSRVQHNRTGEKIMRALARDASSRVCATGGRIARIGGWRARLGGSVALMRVCMMHLSIRYSISKDAELNQ